MQATARARHACNCHVQVAQRLTAIVGLLNTFMNTEGFIFILAPPAIIFASVAAYFLPRRMRMERRARKLLAEHPGAEQTSVYLQFKSAKWSEKQRAHDSLVAEMATKGWTFLRAREASPLRTGLSWAGGVNMHFVRF